MVNVAGEPAFTGCAELVLRQKSEQRRTLVPRGSWRTRGQSFREGLNVAPVLMMVTTPGVEAEQAPEPMLDTTAISVIPSWLKSPMAGVGKNWSQQPLPALSCQDLEMVPSRRIAKSV